MLTSVNLNLDLWRSVLQQSQRDAEWVALHRDRDQRRLTARAQLLELLERFKTGGCSLEEFRATFDVRTRGDWGVFGLKGASGAMFLNMLVKHLPDLEDLARRLRDVLSVPATPDEGRKTMAGFQAYLEGAIRDGLVAKRDVQPARLAFLLSGWWHMQDEATWPIYYQSAREALQRSGLFKESGRVVTDYFHLREICLALGDALSSWTELT